MVIIITTRHSVWYHIKTVFHGKRSILHCNMLLLPCNRNIAKTLFGECELAMHLNIPEPAVSRKTLVATAGGLWLAVGLVLIVRGVLWLTGAPGSSWLVVPAGMALGLLKSRYVLSRLATLNLKRIYDLSPNKERICIFAFQAVQSWLTVIVMVSVGALLRSSPLPRIWLALAYITIGFALALSSRVYFQGITASRGQASEGKPIRE
jgi:hypothetical protein